MAAIAALALAVIALGVLQARWLGELQSAEQERIITGLRRSARFVSEAVDREVGTALRILFARPPRPPNDRSDEALLDRWRQAWDERAPNSLVKALYQVDMEGGKSKLLRFDPDSDSMVATAWPQLGSRLEEFLANLGSGDPRPFFNRPGGRPGGGGGFRGIGGPLLFEEGDSLLVVAPRFGGRQQAPIGAHWAIAELDARALAETVVPRLVREHVGEEYQFALRSRGDGKVLASSGGDIANADLVMELVHGGFVPGMMFRPRQPEPAGPGAPLGSRDDPPGRFPGPPGIWELALRHQAGSVSALVAAGHRRNLWMSFGVLAVMAVALGLVMMNLRRAGALARQQMEFVAAVSHELRTPIAVMRSAADNLADGVVQNEAQARRYGEMLRDQGRTLGDLMEQVLGFAGIVSHGPPKDPKPAAVTALVDDALKACASLIQSSSCTVEKDVAAELPNVVADATWVGLALRNLVQNAVVHGGGKWIRIEARGNGQPARVQIAVEDHGEGIEPGELERIFEPFYRGRGALHKASRGAGLGLAIARRIAEAHGGSLKAESHAGAGSRFILSLPAVKN